MSEGYNGWIKLNEDELVDFYGKQLDLSKYFENEYLFAGTDVYKYQNGTATRCEYPTITSQWGGTLKPRNQEQYAAMDMVNDDNSVIKLITGPWGSGKTMLLAAGAMQALELNKFDKIVWVRNNVQVKDTDALGALPGSELEKVLPYVMPLADHCGGVDGIMRLIQSGRLEVIPLGFLRGRSIRNSLIMCSEAENLTKEHIQLIMGRIDEGSALWLDADTRQRDRASFEKSRGIETMIERLSGEPLFGYVKLEKSERSAAARLADKLND